MITPIKQVLDKGLELNDRLAAAANNGFDWVFRREQLVLSGKSDFEVIFKSGIMSVRHYSLDGEQNIELADGSNFPIVRKKHAVPLVLVPPLGVATETFDLMPKRSLVRYMAAHGFKTYLVCWGKPTRKEAHMGMKDYADVGMTQALAAVRKHSGASEVSLMGWCMGGLLCLLHAGLQPNPGIRNIITVASPIDMRGGGLVAGVAQVVNAPAKLINKYTSFRMQAIDPKSMYVPGWMTTILFKMTAPVSSLTTYWDLMTNLWDRDFVESHSTTSDYLNNMLSYPAGMLQDMLDRALVGNKLGKGKVSIGDKSVSDFRNIHAALLAFAGKSDALVAPSAAHAILGLVSSKDKRFEVAPGGHMGVILGEKAQTNVWARSVEWLATRSAAPNTTPAKPRKRKIAT